MRVNIISRDNGVGLSQDYKVLRAAILKKYPNADVRFYDWLLTDIRRAEINIFLELINPELFRFAQRNIGVFNPEWFSAAWIPYLSGLDTIFAKNISQYYFFRNYHKNAVQTGWVSEDCMDRNITRQTAFLHLRGKSSFKGTEHVLRCWQDNPDLPMLFYVSSDHNNFFPAPNVSNITEIRGYQDRKTIIDIQNYCQFHVCPSKAEGFGHYIAEGLSCGALVLTTNAAPMNELVSEDYGVLLPASPGRHHNFMQLNETSAEEILKQCRGVLNLSKQSIAKKSRLARKAFVLLKRNFEKSIAENI